MSVVEADIKAPLHASPMNTASEVSEFISCLSLAAGVEVEQWPGNACWDLRRDGVIVTISAAGNVDVSVSSGRGDDVELSGDWAFGDSGAVAGIVSALRGHEFLV